MLERMARRLAGRAVVEADASWKPSEAVADRHRVGRELGRREGSARFFREGSSMTRSRPVFPSLLSRSRVAGGRLTARSAGPSSSLAPASLS
jgi:hypothetical protein